MSILKIAFIGLGSIGTRHLKNTCEYLKSIKCDYEIDVYRSDLNKKLSDDISCLITKQISLSKPLNTQICYDAVFITNPTSMHYDTLIRFKDIGKSFFIEKPVFDRADVDFSLFSTLNSSKCYVACPLRYNPVIEYIKNNIDISEVYSVRAISSSYLPDWRPGTDYRECYSAHRDMGGGVDIDLIHEWDYITHIFGDMDCGFCLSDKISHLEIDSNDIAIYIARNKNTTVELHLDYFGRKSIRKIELLTRNDTVNCDILNGHIIFSKSNETINFDAQRNEYQLKEIKHFFDIVFGKNKSDSTIEHALKVLKYAKGDF